MTFVLERLEARGFPAYVVGGCIRDSLMGIPPRDWDVASAALPEEVASIFADRRVIETGKRHGTLTVFFSKGPVEVTTFRCDGEYLDGRRPETVRFINSLENDLARRDFTMNAIAFRRKDGIVDSFGGCRDIAAKVLRSVGEPDIRLAEDALRIMRALRFSATLGFDIDESLAASLHANGRLLTRIAPERITIELLRMLGGAHVLPVLLAYPDVLAVVVPEIAATVGHDQKNRYHRYDVWEHTAHAVAAARPDPLVRLALLMHDLGKPDSFSTDAEGRGHFYGHDRRGAEIARRRLTKLRLSKKTVDCVACLVREHQKPLAPEGVLKWLNYLGEERLRLLIDMKRGDIAAHADDVVEGGLANLDRCEERLDELIAQQACFSLRDLAVDGNDIKELGLPKGRRVGEMLDALLAAVLEGEVANERAELLARARRLLGL
ncbi:MAG: HD domain-containing protein [Coriobacteriales bacterium]|nr:HD domain-containing protein [Coriobacteriales bacterium]